MFKKRIPILLLLTLPLLTIIVLISLLSFQIAQAAPNAVLTVTNNNDDGAGSLRQVIADANPNDTITFDAGISGETITLSSTIFITKNLTISGTVPITISSISGDDAHRIFFVNNDGNVTFDSVTIANGASTGNGGGLYIMPETAVVTVNNCAFSNNQAADHGGAIYNTGTLIVNDSTFAGNSASDFGGAVYGASGHVIIITDSVIRNNTATGENAGEGEGGGIFSLEGSTTISGTTISGNHAARYGGGLVNYDGTITITNSILSDNSAALGGGGMMEYLGTARISNSTLSGNAANNGGGLYNSGNTAIQNSTFSGNSADNGGGIYNYNNGNTGIINSTISGNSAEYGGGIFNQNNIVAVSQSSITDNRSNGSGHGAGIDSYGDISTYTTLINSIVSGNVVSGTTTADDLALYLGTIDSFTSAGYNLIGTMGANITAFNQTGDQTGVNNPQLAPLADNGGETFTHALLSGSPAMEQIPAGTNGCGTTVTSDQRGETRPSPANGRCDIGSYENTVDMRVYGHTQYIANGDSTPAVADDTDFGTMNSGGTPIAHTFTISNSGGYTLTLSGSPIVTLTTGTHFTVTQQPASATVNPQSATTFIITFDPAATGSFSDTVHITNNDADDNPYSFVIGGAANVPPNADAGTDQSVSPSVTVTLDGSGSNDPDGATLTYSWVQTGGTAVTLSDNTAVSPTFTAPSASALLTFTLTVTDAGGLTDTDTVVITVTNHPPVSNAGADQDIDPNVLVTLDGSGSNDPEGTALTYSWAQTGGTSVTLSDNMAVSPTFTAPSASTTLTFTLTVTDAGGLTDTDTVVVTVTNRPPVSNAGADQDVDPNVLVTLDGSGSSDPDGAALTYSWVQTGGTTVTLSDNTAVSPTFTAPADSGMLHFRLTVTDTGGLTHSDTVIIAVTAASTNLPPVADAGTNQSVASSATVTLDGSGSSDPENGALTYSWTQTGGTAVSLSGSTTASPSFTAPTSSGTLTFSLTVTDNGGLTDSSTVTVTVTTGGGNQSPTADAGADQSVNPNDTVTLDGSGSSDPEGGALTYSWTQTGGTAVSLSGNTTASPTFTAPSAFGTLTFKLTVTDSGGLSNSTTVRVTVEPYFIYLPIVVR